MRQAARQFRSDPDVQVIFADAMLNLRPWNQWTRDGRPQPGTLELVTALERVLARTPGHPGACHLYIHAIEASDAPERALPCADRLPKLMPGAGHVVHMPAHVFLRVGRYEDAARANIAAVNADGRYFASRSVPDGIYPLFYAPHNLHFLWATYLLSGQRTKALSTSRALRDRVKLDDARAVPSLEGFLVAEALSLTRFGDWDGVLALPEPPSELRYQRATWHYARGMARAARGDVNAALIELEKVREIAARTPDDVIIILNPAPALLKLAADVLAGTIALQERKYDRAIALFRAAAEKEDALTYDEPPPWYHSARNFLGEALLEGGRAAEAEQAFRDDLRFVRETGWSLDGLERALRVQGKGGEADAVAKRLAKAWRYADVPSRRGG
jgi:tetratricopeptide (TPR) repeat protein